jgi:mannose-6-phosphate isomerase
MNGLYPLRFRPLFRRYIWGNRRLATQLGKAIGPENDYAESWEICDHNEDQSVVEAGPLAGASLGALVRTRGAELLGRHHGQPRFPLLVKFLDAAAPLSVQVHPNDEQAAALDPPDLGKSEAWVILAAEPGSKIYAGLQPGVTRQQLAEAIQEGAAEGLLHCLEPAAGDCIFLAAGTVHALGQGLLVAEVQQSSDVTYRLFDWNRLGPDGKPRPLHVQQGLAAIDFAQGPVQPQPARGACPGFCVEPRGQSHFCAAAARRSTKIGTVPARPTDRPSVERLAECDQFILERWRFSQPEIIGGDGRCHIVIVLEGSALVAGDPVAEPLARGGTALLPASLGGVRISPQGPAVLLDAFIP